MAKEATFSGQRELLADTVDEPSDPDRQCDQPIELDDADVLFDPAL